MRILQSLDRFLLLGLLALNILIIGIDSIQFASYYNKTVIDIDLFRAQHLRKARAAYFDGCVFGVEYFSGLPTPPRKEGLMEYCNKKAILKEEELMQEVLTMGKQK